MVWNHNQTFTLDLPNQHLIKERNKKYQENKETIVKIISTNRLFALRSTKQHNNLSVQNLTTLRHFGSKLVQLYLLCNQNILKKKIMQAINWWNYETSVNRASAASQPPLIKIMFWPNFIFYCLQYKTNNALRNPPLKLGVLHYLAPSTNFTVRVHLCHSPP